MYKRQFWQDHVEGIQEGTDMNAANFNNLEAGTMEANALAALNAAYRRYGNDVAKNSEVVVVKTVEMTTPKVAHYIAIPETATRNNSNYNVFPVLAGTSGVNNVAVNFRVYEKQANGFTAMYYGDMEKVLVDFCIMGGMI